MTPRESVVLTGYIQAHFPQQPINEYTPDALHELLAPYSIDDCKAAVLALATRTNGDNNGRDGKKWCAPTEVYAEVRRLREDRINDEVIDMPPGLDPDDTAAYARVLLEGRRRLAAGQPLPTYELETSGRDVAELGVAGQDVPERHRVDRQQLRRTIAANKAAMTVPDPEPLLRPEDHSREPEPTEEFA